ncbi:sigma-70 family RNA polymerase sigma factor [Candidatus Chloroploca sp. M-50]|uniref:Sigma-70 family RNA polymerase sigma factor n=1 Tax=Candidatus Chloroploca mongolica TaxID=2528176 RepID=A0ABS4DHA5_9CHLR|nr:sigma-70 family RNA polymerase sigma factor [Candidatus Chloroploca mongolica]MBP1468810.1 sigma-70 family RNA polymerase sigma factor [Candidatus Chloroploca mongolica]
MEPDDTTLIVACRAGDQGAWEQLIQRYQRLIYAIPLRAGLGEDAAAEIFQRTFVILFEKLDTLTQPERLRAWLVTTARRECWAYSRSEQRTEALPQDDPDNPGIAELADPGLLPDELIEQMERQHMVREALGRLDPRCRTLLDLLFLRPDPPPYAELAAALGTTEGSIGPTRARCLQKLRAQLAQLDR